MSLFAELNRRNVLRVGIAYAIVGWVIAQVAEFAFENFGAPEWVLKTVVVLLLLGLPIALIFAWAFEMTPDGIKREKEVDRSQSIVAQTGHKLDRIIIAILVVALGWFASDKFSTGVDSESPPEVVVEEAAAVQLRQKSVAVLPFLALSSGQDDEYFADGLTEEILNSLAQLPELLVTARTSAFSFKGQDIPVQEIASALGVRHIVEGSVRRSGDRLRVTAQLIRADDGFHLWSENYDSSSTDTIAVQENIAEQIAAALDVVLDEKKRTAMHKAGLRDVEAFILYQKGMRVYAQAHGEMNTIDGLRQANVFFEQVIERVPDFAQVYLEHSDLFLHVLGDEASGLTVATLTENEWANAYPAAIADYEAAGRYAQTPTMQAAIELDLAFNSDNWRGLGAKIERSLDQHGCDDGNWIQIIANAFGYSERLLERQRELLACDPRLSTAWFNAARTALRTGDKDEALRLAREGLEIAPGEWLSTALVRALIAHGQHAEARKEIDDRIWEVDLAAAFKALVSAHEGNQIRFDEEAAQFKVENVTGHYWAVIVAAWERYREEANSAAAMIDEHPFGSATLPQVVVWCGCGAPFDLEATPNFAAKLKEGNLPWPPQTTMEFPLKSW